MTIDEPRSGHGLALNHLMSILAPGPDGISGVYDLDLLRHDCRRRRTNRW